MRKYYGLSEMAEACNVSPQAVHNWIKRDKMPRPKVRLKMGPVWVSTPALEKFIETKRSRNV